MEKEIANTMFQLGKKYAEQAENAKSIKDAKSAFSLAERAFGLALKAKIRVKSNGDMALDFLRTIGYKEKRSEVWSRYIAYCLVQNMIPVRKIELFDALSKHGFIIIKNRGEFIVKPPRHIATSTRCIQPANTLLE